MTGSQTSQPRMSMLSGFQKVLVFSAHPDDEVIGCGATIRKLASLGANVSVVIATDGVTGVSSGYTDVEDITALRRLESEQTQTLLGIETMHFLSRPTQRLTNDQPTFHECIRLIRLERPDLVLTHSDRDGHRDHQTLSALVREAVGKAWGNIMPNLGPRHRVCETWMYEVIDLLGRPDVVVDVSQTLDVKLKGIAMHQSQHEILERIDDFARGLAQVRGYLIGCPYGEAFKTCNVLPRIA